MILLSHVDVVWQVKVVQCSLQDPLDHSPLIHHSSALLSSLSPDTSILRCQLHTASSSSQYQLRTHWNIKHWRLSTDSLCLQCQCEHEVESAAEVFVESLETDSCWGSLQNKNDFLWDTASYGRQVQKIGVPYNKLILPDFLQFKRPLKKGGRRDQTYGQRPIKIFCFDGLPKNGESDN